MKILKYIDTAYIKHINERAIKKSNFTDLTFRPGEEFPKSKPGKSDDKSFKYQCDKCNFSFRTCKLLNECARIKGLLV